MKTITTIGILAAALASTPLAAQSGMAGMDHSQMQGMDHSKMMQPTAANPYGPAEMKMHEKMMAAMGADAGETWARKMIEHHRGAVEMSQVALRSTQNADVRREAKRQSTARTARSRRSMRCFASWASAPNKEPRPAFSGGALP